VCCDPAAAKVGPILKPAAVEEQALRAAQFQLDPATPYVADSRLTVRNVRVESVGRRFVWRVSIHSTVIVFPCLLPPPGKPAPGCAGARSHDAVVTVDDPSDRALSLKAVFPVSSYGTSR
jgi:hypothetical protein